MDAWWNFGSLTEGGREGDARMVSSSLTFLCGWTQIWLVRPEVFFKFLLLRSTIFLPFEPVFQKRNRFPSWTLIWQWLSKSIYDFIDKSGSTMLGWKGSPKSKKKEEIQSFLVGVVFLFYAFPKMKWLDMIISVLMNMTTRLTLVQPLAVPYAPVTYLTQSVRSHVHLVLLWIGWCSLHTR